MVQNIPVPTFVTLSRNQNTDLLRVRSPEDMLVGFHFRETIHVALGKKKLLDRANAEFGLRLGPTLTDAEGP